MKTLGIFVVVALLVVGGIFLVCKDALPFAHSKVSNVNKTFRDNTSDTYLQEQMEKALSEEGQRLRSLYTNVYTLREKMAGLETSLATNRAKLEQENAILRSAHVKLTSHNKGDTIKVGGATYSWEDLNQDSLDHLAVCKRLKSSIDNEATILTQLKHAYQAAQTDVVTSENKLRDTKTEFEIQVAELAALRAREGVRDMLAGMALKAGDSSGLQKARAAWSERLTVKRAEAEYDSMTGVMTGSGRISTWNSEIGYPDNLAAPQIAVFLAKSDASAGNVSAEEPAVAVPAVETDETPAAEVQPIGAGSN